MNPLAVLRVPRLAARASHEVRGPLTVALLALEGMVARGEVGEDAGRALQLQLDRARLGVDDLAAAASGAAAPDRLEVVPVATVLAQTRLAWREIVVQPGPADVCVLVDPVRLAQALGNLIANAIEHGAPPVVVRARTVSGRVRFEVTDGGSGLRSPLPTLTRRSRGRRGHGLAIASDIAERLGGRLTTAPGATLVIELPARPS
jgi:signal transduction histidine kinase